jgi:hypothetical protein
MQKIGECFSDRDSGGDLCVNSLMLGRGELGGLALADSSRKEEVAGGSELERRLLRLPLQWQLDPTGDERLCRQLGWVITLNDCFDDLRREKG